MLHKIIVNVYFIAEANDEILIDTEAARIVFLGKNNARNTLQLIKKLTK